MTTTSNASLSTARLGDDDVIAILVQQHQRVRTLLDTLPSTTGEAKQRAFDELRKMLAVHEVAEELIVRPVTRDTAGAEVAKQRNEEESEAAKVLSKLEKLDVSSAEFDTMFAEFAKSVQEHAEHEERREFPSLLADKSAEDRAQMGRALNKAESMAPTHPHPSTAGSTVGNATVGPFVSLLDRARDAMSGHND